VSENRYSVSIGKSAQREIKALDQTVRNRVIRALRTLIDPRPSGCKKLVGLPNLWRIRVGDWRVLYEIHDEAREVTIVRVRHRSRAYE